MESRGRAARKGPVVLIAEDDPEILALLSTRLGRRASRVIETQDGESAIVEAERHRPDLVILDVMMPNKNGWEVCRHLRQSPLTENAAIIMVTAIGENLNQITSPLYGADDFIDKPFDLDELDRKIDRALKARQH
jgi:DNA-binding response OmpR family regulator